MSQVQKVNIRRKIVFVYTCISYVQHKMATSFTMVADPEDGVFGLSVHLPLPALLCPELLILISTALHKLQILPISDHKFGCFKCRDSTNENIIVIKLLSALL